MGEGYKCREDVFLHAEKISKIYPGTKALDEVSFDLLRGKVNVLIGENGAGKSTLMKMIAGIEQPNEGKMYIGEEEVYFKNTTEARKHGIGIIHQELSLFPNLNVYQNIYMNKEKTKGRFALDNKVFEVMFEENVDPERYVEEMGLKTVNDEGSLRKTIAEVIAANPQSVADYRSGKEKAIGFLVGQTMKAMKGKADPAAVNQILQEEIVK